jgi:hypothetical protein
VKKEYGTKDGDVPDDKNPFILRKHKDKKSTSKSTASKVTQYEALIEDGEDMHGAGFLPEGMDVDVLPPPSSLEIQHDNSFDAADKKQTHGNSATKPRSLRSILPVTGHNDDDEAEANYHITSSTIKKAPQARKKRFENYKLVNEAEEQVEAAEDTDEDVEKAAAQVKKRKRPPRSTATTSPYFKKR